jgi:hypothetical protein
MGSACVDVGRLGRRWRRGGGGGDLIRDLFVFNDTIEGPRAPAVKQVASDWSTGVYPRAPLLTVAYFTSYKHL